MKSHAWEQRKIGDYLTLSKIPGHTGVDAKKLTVKLWGKGVVEKTDIYGGSQNTQYYVRRAGQFMYGKLDFLHAAFGIVPKSLDRFESTLDSPAFDLHEIDGAFLQNRVTQQNFYLKFGNIANGSRKAKRIHEVTFLDMPIVVPSYAEQKKIGAFLNKLDSLLTLHQRKWVEFFYPTYFRKFSFLNFWEFFNNRITNAWEQRKIGDYLTLSKIPGHTGVDAKKLTVKLWGKGVVEKTDIYGGSQNTQYYVRRAGQFMYGKLDFLHAAFGIVPKSLDRFESTLDSPAFDLHEIDGAFLQNRVTQQNFYLKFGNIANGSRKAKRIHEVTFLDMPIVVPSYAEQKKIGAFLNKLDSLLTLHQRQSVSSDLLGASLHL